MQEYAYTKEEIIANCHDYWNGVPADDYEYRFRGTATVIAVETLDYENLKSLNTIKK